MTVCSIATAETRPTEPASAFRPRRSCFATKASMTIINCERGYKTRHAEGNYGRSTASDRKPWTIFAAWLAWILSQLIGTSSQKASPQGRTGQLPLNGAIAVA